MKPFGFGLILICLLMLLGCSSTPEPRVITVTVTKPLLPPQEFMQRCQVTERYIVETNLDLLNYAKQLEKQIESCDANTSRLIEWSERMRTETSANR
ncbi:hypothetical protein AAY72_01570 [Alishewanella sp. WH16-1]|uniref:Rz1-like lysis system protein LysC n=1 Tax=Alishewanella sp. WH16-1 TaxID=1651088 RepID=UPI000725E91E|nr:hypothetical protein AAY72_01570 [Alishewanella sp. WH16-1]